MEPGWVQAFLQGGALLMVGYVVYVMFSKHLPEQTKAYTDAIRARDEAASTVATEFLKTLRAQLDTYVAEARAEREQNSRNWEAVAATIERQNRLFLYLLGRLEREGIPEEVRDALGFQARPAADPV
jgi:MoxR-like ATPase